MVGLLKRIMESPDVSRLRRRVDAELSPRHSLDLCRALLRRGRGPEAMEVARQGLQRFPHFAELEDLLRTIWKRYGRVVLQEHLEACREEPGAQHCGPVVETLLSYNETGDAAQWADRLVSEFATDPQASILQGRVYMRRFLREHVARDGAQALRAFHRAADLSPGAYGPQLLLARAYAYIGAVKKALAHVYKALDIDPDSEEVQGLYEKLLNRPMEEVDAKELLRRIEEEEGTVSASGPEPDQAVTSGLEDLSAMAGVRRVALCHAGHEVVAQEGFRRPSEGEEGHPFAALAAGFRRTASLSSKRMGIGAFREARLSWRGGSLLVFAAGRSVLLLEMRRSTREETVAQEARCFLALCTASEVEAVT